MIVLKIEFSNSRLLNGTKDQLANISLIQSDIILDWLFSGILGIIIEFGTT